MTQTYETDPKGVIQRIRKSLRRWWAAQRLSTELSDLPDEELNRLLADAGLGRGDLFSAKPGTPRERRRMASTSAFRRRPAGSHATLLGRPQGRRAGLHPLHTEETL